MMRTVGASGHRHWQSICEWTQGGWAGRSGQRSQTAESADVESKAQNFFPDGLVCLAVCMFPGLADPPAAQVDRITRLVVVGGQGVQADAAHALCLSTR